MSDHYHEIGKKEQRNRWRKALRAVQCDGGMSLERAERRVLMGTNADLWRRVVEAIRACNAPPPSAGFTPLQYEGGATSLRLMGGGGLTVSNNAEQITVTGPGSAEIVEGSDISGLTTSVVVELAGTQPDPGTFAVILSGLDDIRNLGLDTSSRIASDSAWGWCTTAQLNTACGEITDRRDSSPRNKNCFCVDPASGQTSTLGLTGNVYRAVFELEIFGSTPDDNIVARDRTLASGIQIASVNGTDVSTSVTNTVATINLTVTEDDIAVVELDTVPDPNDSRYTLVRAEVSKNVEGGFNLAGNIMGTRGTGGSFWEIQDDDQGEYTTGPNSGNWIVDCSDNRDPRFAEVEFGSQLRNIGSEHFVIRYAAGLRAVRDIYDERNERIGTLREYHEIWRGDDAKKLCR